MLPASSTVLHVVVTPPTTKLFLVLLHNYNFATVMNYNVKISVFWWSQMNPVKRLVNPQRSHDPQVENHCNKRNGCYAMCLECPPRSTYWILVPVLMLGDAVDWTFKSGTWWEVPRPLDWTIKGNPGSPVLLFLLPLYHEVSRSLHGIIPPLSSVTPPSET